MNNPGTLWNRALTSAAALAVLGFITSCAANPGPPPIVEEEDSSTTTATTTLEQAPKRSQVQVGVQPLRNGLNPHLLADENSTVRDIAALTLPSAFIRGKLNEDLLVSAELIPVESAEEPPAQYSADDTSTTPATTPTSTSTKSSDTPSDKMSATTSATTSVAPQSDTPAMAVRYILNPAAQWSDGSPITGADFVYLWRGMTTTPGTIDPAGYRAISDIRVSGGGGKTVDVFFDEPVEQWQELFTDLLPSHLLDSAAADFSVALAETIPASAGRFMVNRVDRGSGVIRLNRNDRFWGENPASIDILTLSSVRSTDQTADRLRSGQLSFVDHVPGETSLDTYTLIPGTQVEMRSGPRQLGVVMSVNSPILADITARKELRSLIDVPLIARIAAGRSRDVDAAPETTPLPGEPEALKNYIEDTRPLRIAADPRDNEAMPAARALVDTLNRRGIAAQAVTADMTDVATRMRNGDIDAVISWSHAGGSNAWASTIVCPPADTEFFSGNLSGLCTPATDRLAAGILSGDVPEDTARQKVADVVEFESVLVPILNERRILVRGEGIIGPAPMLYQWDEGVAGAGQWKESRRNNEPNEPVERGEPGEPGEPIEPDEPPRQ